MATFVKKKGGTNLLKLVKGTCEGGPTVSQASFVQVVREEYSYGQTEFTPRNIQRTFYFDLILLVGMKERLETAIVLEST